MDEPRRVSDYEIGQIAAKVEGISRKMDEHMVSDQRSRQELEERIGKRFDGVRKDIEGMVKRIETVTENLSFWRHMLFFLKALGAIIVAVLMFKFGDVSKIWKAFLQS